MSGDDWEQHHHSVLRCQESFVSINGSNCIGILMVSFQHTCHFLWISHPTCGFCEVNINTPLNNQMQICDLQNELLCIALCAHHETTTDISVQRYLHIYSTYLQLPISALHCRVTRPNNHSHIWCYGKSQQAFFVIIDGTNLCIFLKLFIAISKIFFSDTDCQNVWTMNIKMSDQYQIRKTQKNN